MCTTCGNMALGNRTRSLLLSAAANGKVVKYLYLTLEKLYNALRTVFSRLFRRLRAWNAPETGWKLLVKLWLNFKIWMVSQFWEFGVFEGTVLEILVRMIWKVDRVAEHFDKWILKIRYIVYLEDFRRLKMIYRIFKITRITMTFIGINTFNVI